MASAVIARVVIPVIRRSRRRIAVAWLASVYEQTRSGGRSEKRPIHKDHFRCLLGVSAKQRIAKQSCGTAMPQFRGLTWPSGNHPLARWQVGRRTPVRIPVPRTPAVAAWTRLSRRGGDENANRPQTPALLPPRPPSLKCSAEALADRSQELRKSPRTPASPTVRQGSMRRKQKKPLPCRGDLKPVRCFTQR